MKYTAYAIRQSTDRFVGLPPGAAKFAGPMAEAAAFVERKSLLDPKLWCVFVSQFKRGSEDNLDMGWRSEYWGKMMRGACITYEYDRNEALYAVMEETVRDLLDMQDEFGRITSYNLENEFRGWDVWGRKYVMLGLEYFLEICRDDILADRIVNSLRRQADYMIAKTGCGEAGKLDVTNTSEAWEGLNASSILEPVVRLYHVTGEARYLDYAAKIIRCGGTKSFNIFEAALADEKAPCEYPVTKAYEMMSCFEGILEFYRATGDGKYLQMVRNFAAKVIATDVTVIGSAGTTHELFDHSRINQFNPAFKGIMQETCVTVTWMKFCLQLLAITGDGAFADNIELSAYNALLGAVNFEENPFRGEVFAFDSYSPLLNSSRGLSVGGYKTLLRGLMHWGCCVAIGACGTGLFPRYAGMLSADKKAPVVNFYVPGEIGFALPDGDFSVRIETGYPYQGDVRIVTTSGRDNETPLLLRIPAWSRETVISVNEREADFTVENGYATLSEAWKEGDIIDVRFDMRVRVIRAAEIDPDASPESVCHAAIMRGPLVLARDSVLEDDVTSAVCFPPGVRFLIPREVKTGSLENGGKRLTVVLETEDGPLVLCDYASAGRDWGKSGPVTCWVRTKQVSAEKGQRPERPEDPAAAE